ncbi:MAG: helix-turn-helix transcriptional regulator [Chloroflexaceae bacterium]|nr:helix-turn-helix transcriptional regulator [Chloroflexaceae bacterium]
MTMRELANAIGYTAYSHISLIEKGKREPSLKFVRKVADFFGVTVDQLVRDEQDV